MRPNARVSSIEQAADGTYIAHVKAPPVDGRANAELLKLVAMHFGCRQSAVSIKLGGSGRTKLVVIDGR